MNNDAYLTSIGVFRRKDIFLRGNYSIGDNNHCLMATWHGCGFPYNCTVLWRHRIWIDYLLS